MATLNPFRILRPDPAKAAAICCLPYDVMNTEEARAMAGDNPLSFLRVTRPEIELPEDADPYSNSVYERGAANLRRLIAEGHLVREERPIYMFYRLVMGGHSQTGLVAAASCAEYDAGIVKKHELTRPDKEDDRTRHIEILGAQTGAVFLTFRANAGSDSLFAQATAPAPDIDFTAEDGIRHTAWFVRDPATIARIQQTFSTIPCLYVADGHHRSAAASRVARKRAAASPSHTGNEPGNFFLTVTFPHHQMQILGYHRVVKDLNGLSPAEFLAKLEALATRVAAPADNLPRRKGEFTVYLDGQWHLFTWKPGVADGSDTVACLDISVLQDKVLHPMLAIGDPRTDKRIAFVGGIRGPRELQRLVDGGKGCVAFALFPTSIQDLMAIADEDGLMPPKSTWFEPKLRDAMAVHLIGD